MYSQPSSKSLLRSSLEAKSLALQIAFSGKSASERPLVSELRKPWMKAIRALGLLSQRPCRLDKTLLGLLCYRRL